MNVALWSEALVGGHTGTRTFLTNVVSRWIKDHADSVRLSLVVLNEKEEAKLKERLPAGDWQAVRIRGRRWPLRLGWLAGRANLTDSIGPHDLFLSGWHWPLGGSDRPFVGIIHDLRILEPGWTDPRIGILRKTVWRMLYARSAEACVARAAAIVAPSAYTLQHMRDIGYAPRQPTYVIQHGIDRSLWSNEYATAQHESVLRRFGLAPDTPYVLSIGPHTPHKNMPKLVEAFADGVARVDPSACLLIAGATNSETPRLESLIASSGLQSRVKLLGAVASDELPPLMAGARVFAFVSLFEGFGIPVLEAFAAGVPVLTSRTTSLVEVAGDAAITVDPESRDDIASALARLWSDAPLRQELSQRGLSRSASYDWDRAAASYVNVFQSILRPQKQNAALPTIDTTAH